jgi:hypothetical protein
MNSHHLTLEEENYDSISQRDTENSDIFDNFKLCQRYGQANIEKAIFLLISILLITGLALYYNIKIIKPYLIKIIYASSIVDLLLLIIYTVLRLKFNNEEWLNSFPIRFYSYIDYIILLNSILKIVIFVLSFLYQKSLGSLGLFLCKFLLELYLLVSCVKILIFCPGYKALEEFFERAVGWIKYLLICCESEHEQDVGDYKRLYDDSTNFDINPNSQNGEIQFI